MDAGEMEGKLERNCVRGGNQGKVQKGVMKRSRRSTGKI